MNLKYTPLEYIQIGKPVNRIDFIVNQCSDKIVLDLGCWDETALIKRETDSWLHKSICQHAKYVIGIDNSKSIPEEGYISENSKIIRGDILDINTINKYDAKVIIAGELIEHLPDTLLFFSNMKQTFPGNKLICSTPNATCLSNFILAFINRESMHQDHLNIFSYKTLNTLCIRTGFKQFRILPYHVKFSEMIARNRGVIKKFIKFSEKMINFFESLFPFLSGGYILEIDI